MGLSSILIIPLHGLQPKHSAWGAGGGGVIEGCLCWVFLAVWAFSSFSEQALHSSCGARASPCGISSGSKGVWVSVVAARRLSSCNSGAQLLCSMWNLPRPGIEPVSPASAGRFFTPETPGKPREGCLMSRNRPHCAPVDWKLTHWCA